jgi:hypothetical protein
MISDTLRNSHNAVLPNTVRTLPNLGRFQNQGNALSLDQICQGTTNKILPDLNMEFWDDFEDYLVKSYRKSSVRCRLLYAKKYFTVIKEEKAQVPLVLPYNKRLQVMKSLAILSKFLGCYDKWKQIKERYHLKWSNDDSIQVFQNLTNQENNYSSMLKWVKDTCKQIPLYYANILIYCTLTGFRPSEAISSIYIIKANLYNYLDKDKMILELSNIQRFSFPEQKTHILVLSMTR